MRGSVTLFTAMRKEILDARLAGPWRLTLVACACAKVATRYRLFNALTTGARGAGSYGQTVAIHSVLSIVSDRGSGNGCHI